MKPVDESRLPEFPKTQQAFRQAMDDWDESAADTAVVRLARTAGSSQVFELLYRYGARDFRDIGHKAIFVANTQRVPAASRLASCRASPAVAGLRASGARGRQSCAARCPGRPSLAAQPGIGGPDPRRMAGGQAEPRGDCGIVGGLAAGHGRCRMRRGGATAAAGDGPAVALGCALLRGSGVAPPTTGHRRPARRHDHQRPALRLPDQRRRPDPAVAALAERGLPAHVPPGDGRPRPSAGHGH